MTILKARSQRAKTKKKANFDVSQIFFFDHFYFYLVFFALASLQIALSVNRPLQWLFSLSMRNFQFFSVSCVRILQVVTGSIGLTQCQVAGNQL